MRYAIIIEPGVNNFSAYVPDLPGCVATGQTKVEVKQRMLDAIDLHLVGLHEDGLENPAAVSLCDYVEVVTVA